MNTSGVMEAKRNIKTNEKKKKNGNESTAGR